MKAVFEVKKVIVNIPTPSSLSYMWSFGSILGVFLTVQIVSGVFLSFHYSPSVSEAFESVIILSEDVQNGWIIRSIHANGASFFFLFMFFHIGRGVLYESFKSVSTWLIGVVILLSSMATAFLGYVLPWGQMSYWGATVITNLLSALPRGEMIVTWVWGGFSVSGPTLSRFFSLHFILPFVIMFIVVVHIFSLHKSGSSNPLGVGLDSDKIYFHPSFVVKDLLGFMLVGLIFISLLLLSPDFFMDPDNFTPANSLSTPPHIQPEWYFLFAYAILRSIPSKLGGVVALFSSVCILAFLPILSSSEVKNYSLHKILFWSFVSIFLLLTWTGSMPAEGPMILWGQVLTFLYFSCVLMLSIL